MTDDEYREVANELLESVETPHDFTVDDRAEVKPSLAGDGAWVSIWLWVQK